MVIENRLNRNGKVRDSTDEVGLQLGRQTYLTLSVIKTVLKLNSVVEKSHDSQCYVLIFLTEMRRNVIITSIYENSKAQVGAGDG